jgi:hypothetical protein
MSYSHFAIANFVCSARRSPRQVVVHTCKGCNEAGSKISIALRVVIKMGIYFVRELECMNHYTTRSLPRIYPIFTDNKIHITHNYTT